jgi:hypothetical protein
LVFVVKKFRAKDAWAHSGGGGGGNGGMRACACSANVLILCLTAITDKSASYFLFVCFFSVCVNTVRVGGYTSDV